MQATTSAYILNLQEVFSLHKGESLSLNLLLKPFQRNILPVTCVIQEKWMKSWKNHGILLSENCFITNCQLRLWQPLTFWISFESKFLKVYLIVERVLHPLPPCQKRCGWTAVRGDGRLYLIYFVWKKQHKLGKIMTLIYGQSFGIKRYYQGHFPWKISCVDWFWGSLMCEATFLW